MSAYLWVIDFSYAGRLHHGGLVRYFNLSSELLRLGHTVTFAVNYEGDRELSMEWMNSMRNAGTFTDHCEIAVDGSVPKWSPRATLLLPFGLQALAIRRLTRLYQTAMDSILRQHPFDVAIISSRRFLFIGHQWTARPSIADFTDSVTLYFWREMTNEMRRGNVTQASRHFRDLYHFFFQELYGSRRYPAGIIVSPVDKKVFDRIGIASRNVYLPNGVRAEKELDSVAKIPDQIVFSGAMNFPPNYDSALWFLDHVFPLIVRRRPQVRFVIAGASPVEKLLARAAPNVEISGYVPDLNLTLAQSALYVAPLVSGSGFKNKVVEAFVNGTYVIGTSLATEFLEPSIRDLVTVTDDPAEMADAVCGFLENPGTFEDRRKQLYRIAVERFSWPGKAAELARLADSLIRRR